MTSNHVAPHAQSPRELTWQTLVEFTVPRELGSEGLAVDRVTEAVHRLNWSAAQLEQLRLALAQAAHKATECSCRYASDVALVIRVLTSENDPATPVADQAGGQPIEHGAGNSQGQRVGRPPSRGWGFFLIEKAASDPDGSGRHLLELFLYPGGK